MEINELIVGGIGLLTTITSGWVSWFFARKKYNAEVDHSHIENMQESLNFYKQLSDDNKVRLEEIAERNKALERELQEALKEISNLRKQVLDLTLNICMDLTCEARIKENQRKKKVADGKVKDRFDETKSSSRG